MKKKLVFVLLDGLNYDAAYAHMGYMLHLSEKNRIAFFRVNGELPSMSRPIYEVLMTGTPSSVNGISNNFVTRRSNQVNLFRLAKEQGYRTAAAAYYWFSELYNSTPFDRLEDRETENESLDIQFGRFYFEDSYPDSHLFSDGHGLILRHRPEFVLIHPMGIDHIGHMHGGNSKEYRLKAVEADILLSSLLPVWTEMGYDIIVTSDHGMNEFGFHGGGSREERMVPLWIVSADCRFTPREEVGQLEIAPLVCDLLSLRLSAGMGGHGFERA